MKFYSVLFLVYLAFFSDNSFALAKQRLKVAAIDWCPQLCPNPNVPFDGYISDVVELVYQDSDIVLSIDYFPWSRAIKMVRSGEYDALLSPAKLEAPDLVYPNLAVGTQRMCFFVEANSNWIFDGTNSLAGRSIGIAQDTSIEELNSYIESNKNQFQFQPYHDRFVEQNAKKILRKRIDTFLFTRNTTIFELQQVGLDKAFKEAGCVNKVDIYMAFTPNPKNQKLNNKAIDLFEVRMSELIKNGMVAKIMHKYNLVD